MIFTGLTGQAYGILPEYAYLNIKKSTERQHYNKLALLIII